MDILGKSTALDDYDKYISKPWLLLWLGLKNWSFVYKVLTVGLYMEWCSVKLRLQVNPWIFLTV